MHGKFKDAAKILSADSKEAKACQVGGTIQSEIEQIAALMAEGFLVKFISKVNAHDLRKQKVTAQVCYDLCHAFFEDESHVLS